MTKSTRITILFAAILIMPLAAMLNAKIYSWLWGMTLAMQYGDGPSYLSWYGISVLGALLTWHLSAKGDGEEDPDKIIIGGATRALTYYIVCGLSLGFTAFVVYALGWS